MWLMSVDKIDRRPVWGDLPRGPVVKNPPYNVVQSPVGEVGSHMSGGN